jgi:hypothetical protein
MDSNTKAKKLGKNYIFDTLSSVGLNTEPSKNSRIGKYKFNVINLGTLKRPVPTAVLEKQIFFDDSFRRTQILNEAIDISSSDKYFKCVTNFSTQSYGDYSYFAPFKIRFDFKETQFFKPVFNRPVIYGKNVDFNTPFVRLNVPLNLSNTNFLTGTNSIYNGAVVENIINSGIYISGYDSGINYAKRNTFLYTGISGFSGYVAYPQTVTDWSYPKYSIDSILSMNSLFTYVDNENDMKGLLVVSTGDNTKQNIVYISPHGIAKTTGHTVIETISTELSRLQPKVAGFPPRYVYKKVSSGINMTFLDVDSQYANNEPVFESGLSFGNISGLSLKGRLRQTTPLKDTIFYKLYNSFYSGHKTINTGTWDGIIPANTNFTIEYITTKNQVVGTNNEFKLFYKNYGDNSDIDIQLQSGMFDGTILNAYGYSINNDSYSSIRNSNTNLRRSMNRRYNEYTKNLNLRIYDYSASIGTEMVNGSTVNIYQYNEMTLMNPNSKYNSFLKFISGLNI